MQLQFEHPMMLLIWPVLCGLVLLGTRWMRAKSTSRKVSEVFIRSLVLLLVVAALAKPSIKKSSNLTTTIFLVDLSDSMSDSVSDEADFVRQAIAEMPASNQAGIIVFGADARIEQFVSDKKAFTEFHSAAVSTATNLEQAVQTAIALFPDESAKRLVLLTDGKENDGDLTRMSTVCSSLDAGNLEIKVVRYEEVIGDEVYVSDVTLPDAIHEGDQFQVKVTVYSSVATKAKVSLYSGRTLKGQREVTLQKGDNQLVFTDQGVESGLKSYRVTVDAEKDTRTINNTYSAYTTVEAKSRLLVVEGTPGEGEAFKKVLEACNYNYDMVSPGAVPNKLADLNQYQSVVLLNVYADDLRSGFLDVLETYVKDYAGGFVCIGGEDSYALGNYRDTAIEKVLPVSMDLTGEKQIPSIAMVMVIDHSGSMSSPSTMKSTVDCLTVAKQAALNAIDSLREIDEVGVVAFDDTYTWAVELQKVTNPDGAKDGISSITIGGGTSIYPAVDTAVEALLKSSASIKHVVLLTDGQDGYHGYDTLIKKINENGITLSTVAVGTDSDMSMLEDLAERGGGRYYYSDADSNMPRIFAQEVFMSTKSYLKNEEFVPTIVNSHEIISGIFDKGSPSLKGYIATSPKSNSTVILESDEEDPVLAVWQYGLGKAVAWTSDGSGKWTGNFSGWDNYAALWQNILDWTISDSNLGGDTLSVSQKASSAVLTYQTTDFTADTEITAIMTSEDGKQQEVTLKASKPGTFTAEVPLNETGVYSISVRNSQNGQVVKSTNTATAMQYSREYRYGESSMSLDNFITQTGAKLITSSEEVFDSKLNGAASRKEISAFLLILGMILFLLDTVFRRMRVDWLAGIGKVFHKINPNVWWKKRKNVDKELITGKTPVENRGKTVNNSVEKPGGSVNSLGKDINNAVHNGDKVGKRVESGAGDAATGGKVGGATGGSVGRAAGGAFGKAASEKAAGKAEQAVKRPKASESSISASKTSDSGTSASKASTAGSSRADSAAKKSGGGAIDTKALLNKKKKRDS